MNYKFETIMSWITYVKNAVWGVDKKYYSDESLAHVRKKSHDVN